ncbi:hypothetical protein KCP73_06590 [Salmonella enterica subsp. enterica]|nr:hypothetical protein KCP73_06590 [Salmonella enterica subsp. enterica]
MRLKGTWKRPGAHAAAGYSVCREVHTLVGAGGASGGRAAEPAEPALARGTLRTIGATAGANTGQERNPALTRRFQVLPDCRTEGSQ